jgi:signal transduction histidine kinase
LIAPQMRDRKLRYELHTCGDDVLVRADPDKLQQVLLNLVSNAIKYTPVGGAITVRCEVVGRRVRIDVTDTGIGIASERQESIFDPFIQVGRALNRPHEGVGLGLSISRDLAHGMGGELTVKSELGAGSTFSLLLERAK